MSPRSLASASRASSAPSPAGASAAVSGRASRRRVIRDGSAMSMPKPGSSISPVPCRWNDSYTSSDGRRTPWTSRSAVTITSASRAKSPGRPPPGSSVHQLRGAGSAGGRQPASLMTSSSAGVSSSGPTRKLLLTASA
ncbi:hypothetical protein BJF79_12895 [Actinomadura sp. CNU-125]|nr:hypothetical protein [Actinomadura sp. CNU-125]OLT25066.1 hypothetical protein BJF79_12895 [Actinomadura sp. CNU-125]